MDGSKKMRPHAIMISLPFQGHINPFVNLALNLASSGIAVTFVHLECVHNKISKAGEADIFSDARASGLEIRYTTIPDGFPLDYDRDLHLREYWDSLYENFPPRVDEFVANMIRSDKNSAYFLVADILYGWTAAIARKHNIVSVVLWVLPALAFSVLYHRDLMIQNGHIPSQDIKEDLEIDYLPGVASIKIKDLRPSAAQSENVMSKDLAVAAMNEAKKVDFILQNTVEELESDILSALNNYQPNYAVGPLSLSRMDITRKSLWAESDCTKWLESKPPGSVLYVSFGSLVKTGAHVMEEIAYGILLSEVSFIWVGRASVTGSAGSNGLPIGFEDKVKDRGLIVPWCDQINVLSNPAVGGFLTHCGWNSVVESMWCGVPMICYPFSYDQPANKKHVVDDWKIGISLCDGSSVDRKEVAEKIRRFIKGGGSERFRQDAENVKQTIHNALGKHGSSRRNFDKFVKDLQLKLYQTSTP